MRELVDAAMDRIIAHVESLPDQAGVDTEGGEALARSLKEDLPETGRPYPELLEALFERIVPKSLNSAAPGFLAYIPGGGLFHAAVGDLIANSINRYVTVWSAAPGLAQLEANVVRWFCDTIGYPAEAGGYLASGASLANFSAVVTARRERLPENFLNGTIYMSDQTHHSITKAAMLAGFPVRNVRTVAVDAEYRIRRRLIVEAKAPGAGIPGEGAAAAALVLGPLGVVTIGAGWYLSTVVHLGFLGLLGGGLVLSALAAGLAGLSRFQRRALPSPDDPTFDELQEDTHGLEARLERAQEELGFLRELHDPEATDEPGSSGSDDS